jgi:hypothetical protein
MTRGYKDTMVVQLTPSTDSTNFSLVILQGKINKRIEMIAVQEQKAVLVALAL